ncbi:hypothetical protein Mpet_1458 [Methanolacinia petrolearia DSM 11571]|uniref:Uncharacterized protein n=1 Tax=Methanolacinia petrolearia (strain DSM 11571 / OCM 486 / SEBR 4847) TaxID=679926 RepID=E1RFI7_METP4|nr:hypothetical protein [Methanolacinia petrolearia]ADN36217.1 hypothetical protein Mpet_1458 [Methanolacinia petrolearia DSM 11571]
MPDTYTPNLGLTKPCTRKNWAEAVNENFEKLGVLHYYHTDGWMFICKNAICNNGVWTQPDTNLQSSVIALGNDGSFTLQTCPAGSPTITSWTAVMTVTSAGAVTLASEATFGANGTVSLPNGVAINSSGTLTLPGDLSVAGTISGNITALLLLSQMTISDKDWGGHNITNLGQITTDKMILTPTDTIPTYLLAQDPSGGYTSAESYTLVLALSVAVPSYVLDAGGASVVKVAYDFGTGGSPSAYARIYINGVAVGSEHHINIAYYSETVREEIPVSPGDIIQVYCHGVPVYFGNLRVYGFAYPISIDTW